MTLAPIRRPRGRPPIPPEVQRQRLVEGLVRAIDKHGYDNARVLDIVREAGMSSRSFYELFASKEDLIGAYVEEKARSLFTDLEAVLRGADDPVRCIDRALEVYLGVFSGIHLDLESLRGPAGARVRAVRRDYAREISQAIFAELSKAHEKGRISQKPDLVSVELIITGIEGMSFRYLAEGRIREFKDLRGTILKLLARAFVRA